MPEKEPKEPPSAYGLRMTASDGMVTYFYRESLHRFAQTGKQKISLFPTKKEAETVRTIQNIGELDCYDIVKIVFVEGRIDIYDAK